MGEHHPDAETVLAEGLCAHDEGSLSDAYECCAEAALDALSAAGLVVVRDGGVPQREHLEYEGMYAFVHYEMPPVPGRPVLMFRYPDDPCVVSGVARPLYVKKEEPC